MHDGSKFSGIGQYSSDLAKILITEGYEVNYVSMDCDISSLPNLTYTCIPDPFKNFRYKSNLYELSLYNLSSFRRFTDGYVHITSQFLIPLGAGRKNVAITVHDLTQLRVAPLDLFSWTSIVMKLSTLKRYRFILTDSNYVKEDVLQHFRVNEDSIHVLYNWIDMSKIKITGKLNEKNKGDKVQLIHVGNDRPNKDINLIYKLMKLLPENYELIRVGSNSARNIGFVSENGLTRRITFYERVPSEKLEDIYNTADVFIYPSSSEGFGRPLLEAMAHGLPVVYRNSSSLPEIAGDAGLRFENEDLSGIAELVSRAVDPVANKILRRKSIERSRFFDIKNQRRNITELYKIMTD